MQGNAKHSFRKTLRRFGKLRYKRSRAEQKQLLISEGCEFFKDDMRKLRYVGFYGDKQTKRLLRAALRWEVLPYPKRVQSPEDRVQVFDLGPFRIVSLLHLPLSLKTRQSPRLAHVFFQIIQEHRTVSVVHMVRVPSGSGIGAALECFRWEFPR
jgi:hypothetical protein